MVAHPEQYCHCTVEPHCTVCSSLILFIGKPLNAAEIWSLPGIVDLVYLVLQMTNGIANGSAFKNVKCSAWYEFE